MPANHSQNKAQRGYVKFCNKSLALILHTGNINKINFISYNSNSVIINLKFLVMLRILEITTKKLSPKFQLRGFIDE